MKPIVWVATSLEDVRRFPEDAKRDIGYQLFKIQAGLEPSDWKPMPGVGSGVREIRVHKGREFRVLYVATLKEAVYVIHAFVKKSGRTSSRDMEIAAARYRRIRQDSEGRS